MTPKMMKSFLFLSIILCAFLTVVGNVASFDEDDLSCKAESSLDDSSFLPTNSNDSILYYLYTPERPKEVCFFQPNASNLCEFDPTYETKILIHGYTVELLPGNFFEQIKDALLDFNKYNVIIVDWTKYNKYPYPAAVAKAYLVAINIGSMINFLVSSRGVQPSNIHIIAHSLGAHVAGVAGNQVPILGRITGLDPAGPLFNKIISYNRLTNTSAELVDVMHTSISSSGLGLGLGEAIGTIDFYPNGGYNQPACQMGKEYRNADAVVFTITSQQTLGSCLHNIALPYFLSSIRTCKYHSVRSETYEAFSEGKFNSESNFTNRMGLHTVKIPGLPVHSKFYLNTAADPPYCEKE